VRLRLASALPVLLFSALVISTVPRAEEGTPAPSKPKSPSASSSAKKKGTQTQTSPASTPSEQTQGGVTVRENYYLELPGFDLSTLTPKQKDKFRERVNKELCTCGCANDTVARCLVNDPKCPVVRGLAEKIFSEVKAGS
jgi:hypothetical protein